MLEHTSIDHHITNETFDDYALALAHYHEFDKNGFHYFEGNTHPLLKGTTTRFVPGAVLAVTLWGRIMTDEALEGSALRARLFVFNVPTLSTIDGKIYTSPIEGAPHGVVTSHALDLLPSRDDLAWIKKDLYEAMGELWEQEGSNSVAEGRIPIVRAIGIGSVIGPEHLVHLGKGVRVRDYRRGQIAVRDMSERAFGRTMGPYLHAPVP